MPRQAVETDLSAIVSLHDAVWHCHWPDHSQPAAAELLVRYQQYLMAANHRLLVGYMPHIPETSATLLGFALLMPNPDANKDEYPWWLIGPHSHPDHADRGIKRRLIGTNLAFCRGRKEGVICWSRRESLRFQQHCLDQGASLLPQHLSDDHQHPDLPPQKARHWHIACAWNF